jgi:AraC family transcriptional regulator of adaptative response/methylated-DNA-[protein]-cysteine methyltransferase
MSPRQAPENWSTDYSRVESAIAFLERNFREQPSLRDIARSVHLSESRLHHLFRRWAGIGPKRFLELITLEHAKALLTESRSVLHASLESGLSGPGRLHDLFVTIDAVTPGEFKDRGAGLRIAHAFHPTPFGPSLIALTDRGICHLGFVTEGRERAARALRAKWPGASFAEDPDAITAVARQIFPPAPRAADRPLSLLVRGTNFQVKVWEALLRIPPGAVICYEAIARDIGCPRAARAVGQAVACNPVAYLIPCHRVIRKIGALGSYRWGASRKRAMLVWEAARDPASVNGTHRVTRI